MNNSDVEILEEVELLDFNKPKKSKVIKKTIIIAVLLVLIISISGITIGLILPRKNSNTSKITFFIKNQNNLYAIFDNYGNKLSDFIYKEKNDFIHDTALVCDNNGKYAIISSSGNIIINSEKYNSIERKKGIYIARDFNDIYILDSKGKEKFKINEKDIIYTAVEDVAILKSKNKYLIINYDGDILLEMKINENKGKPILDSKNEYLIVYYNDNNYIINLNSKKIIQTIKENQRYCISDINDNDSNKIIIYSCIINPAEEAKYNYKVINNGKLSIEKNSNDLANLRFLENNILYSTNKNKYLLDSDGKEKLQIENIQFIDKDNFAKVTEEGINIYVDNEVKTKTNCKYLSTSYADRNIYLLENCNTSDNNSYFTYYDKNGKKIGKNNYYKAKPFDENDRAIVSEDNNNYYLIDNKGNSIGERYHEIEKVDNYYIGINTDISKLYDKEGNILAKGNSISKKDFINYSILLIRKNKKYILYNAENQEKIATLKSVPILEDNYFIIKDKNIIKYYSYLDGNMFYKTT